MRQIAVLHLKPRGRKLLGDPWLGCAAVTEQHMAAAAERFQRVDQFVIVHLIDGGVDGAAAAIGVAQESENFAQRVAGKIQPRLESRGGQVLQKLVQRRIGHVAIDEAADDLGHQRPAVEVSLQPASSVAGHQLRHAPARRRRRIGREGAVRRTFHRGDPI